MINFDWRQHMLEAVDRYCAATGRARSGAGQLIMKDAKFFDEIADGRNCNIDNYNKVMLWLKENTPQDIEKSGVRHGAA